MMHARKTYLFRFDGAAENDEFLELARSNGHIVYAGLGMTLERGWIPDFVEVSLENDTDGCVITLLELEATANAALAGSRKYLPESSVSTVRSFSLYLERVLQRCRSAADPRVRDLQELHSALSSRSGTTVWTAAALRRPPQVIERLPLIDQDRPAQHPMVIPRDEMQLSTLDGVVSLSSRDHKALSRSVLILDAVVRGWDNSDACLRAWRGQRSQPLRAHIRQHASDFPALFALLLGPKLGVRFTINAAARELSDIWNGFEAGRYSEASVLSAIADFLPIDRTLDPTQSVRTAFAKARLVLEPNRA